MRSAAAVTAALALSGLACAPLSVEEQGIHFVGSCEVSGLHICGDYYDPAREAALISACGQIGATWSTQPCDPTGEIGSCNSPRENGAYQITHVYPGAYSTWPTDCVNAGGTWTPAG
jgi:hypothetical protein